MGRRHSPALRRRLERGSALIEGLVALAVAFLLLTLVVQLAFGLVARNAAQHAVADAARRAAHQTGAPTAADLEAMLRRAIPGADEIRATIEVEDPSVVATATVGWDPPGPRWVPVSFTVRATAPLVVAP